MTIYCIVDVKHSLALRSLRGGGALEHGAPEAHPHALWRLEENDGLYRIADLARGDYVLAPELYDGTLAHGPLHDGAIYEWRVIPMFDGPGGALAVTIKDAAHNKAITAGDIADGRIYHDDPDGRMNAFWTLVPVAHR